MVLCCIQHQAIYQRKHTYKHTRSLYSSLHTNTLFICPVYVCQKSYLVVLISFILMFALVVVVCCYYSSAPPYYMRMHICLQPKGKKQWPTRQTYSNCVGVVLCVVSHCTMCCALCLHFRCQHSKVITSAYTHTTHTNRSNVTI